MSHKPLIFLIAGEASGDQLGADLMASLKSIQEVRFAGIGGEAMKAQGLQSLFPMEELSLIGVFSILRNIISLMKRLTYAVKTIECLKPDVVVTIDAPEFCLRVMKRLHKKSSRPRLIHYVAPTVWAWRSGRAKKIAQFLDGLLCLYPFEPPYFEKYGLNATFVGHPAAKFKVTNRAPDSNLLCLLPGSRRSEIETLLPIFKETVSLIKKDQPDLKVIIPTLSSVESLVRKGIQNFPCNVQIVIGDEERGKVFQKASVALAASGTVALQLSSAKLPFLIAYKVGKITEWVARTFLKTPWVCMVNILLAFQKFGPNFPLTQKVKNSIPDLWIPEFLQNDCAAEKIAPVLLKLIKNKGCRMRQIKAMEDAMKLLKAPHNIAAKTVLKEIDKS